MEYLNSLEIFLNGWADLMWGTPLVILLVGGGIYFMIHSSFKPYRYFGHAINLILGKHDSDKDPGSIPHSQALATALSGTLGLGNIAGVAIAITVGGPGSIFWMWITAIAGVSTKFYTASLSVMYRKENLDGQLCGGPMYVITEGMGRRWFPLAAVFSVACMIGALPIFQANQFVQLLRDLVAEPLNLATKENHFSFDLVASLIIASFVALVIRGKIQRIGTFAIRIVPTMIAIYLFATSFILFEYFDQIPDVFVLIINDAFTGSAVAGGSLGTVIMIGIRRGAFSNEAGIGTESMAHGTAKTREPIREGLVAMMGPVIDTLIMCTATAFIILLTGVWEINDNLYGVTLTAIALDTVFPFFGKYLLLVMVGFLSFTTMVTMWFYGVRSAGFLFGEKNSGFYTPVYLTLLIAGSVVSLDIVNGLILATFATMAIPTMISTLYLSPKVKVAANQYFEKIKK